MIDVGALVASLSLDNKRFVMGMKTAGKTVKPLQDDLVRLGKTRFKALKDQIFSLKGAVLGLAGAYGIKKLTGSFIDAASTAEQYKIRLTALLGSVDEGNRLFQDMAKYAGEVPFEYEKIMGAATQLSGIMKGGVDEINKWMPLIGDLAAVSGLGIEKTTEQIVRMYSAGAASADLFRERGITAMLGFQTGVSYTAEETRRRLIEAWEDPTSKFRDATKELAKSWEGLLSMMSDKWFQFRNMIMEAGVFEELKKYLIDINDAFAGWMTTNEEIIKQKVPEYIKKIKDSVVGIWDFVKSNKDMIEYGLLGLVLFGKKGAIILAGIGAYSDALRKWSESAKDVDEHQRRRIIQWKEEILEIENLTFGVFNLSEKEKARIKILESKIKTEETSLLLAKKAIEKAKELTDIWATQDKAMRDSLLFNPEKLGEAKKGFVDLTEYYKLQMKEWEQVTKDFTIAEKALWDERTEAYLDRMDKEKELIGELTEFHQKAIQDRMAAEQQAMITGAAFAEDSFKRYQAAEEAKEKITRAATMNMLQNWAYAFKELGKQSKTAFTMFKAISIAETIVNTIAAAQAAFKAMAGIPIIGPALGVAAAAAAIAAGMARVSQINAITPEGGGGISTGGGMAGPAVGTYPASPTTGIPEFPGAEEAKPSLTVVVEGDFYGEEEFVNRLAERLNEAVENRSVRVVSSEVL